MKTGARAERAFRQSAAMIIASAVFLAAGLYGIFNRYEPAISKSAARSELLYAQTLSNERALDQAVRLKSLEKTALADIARVSKETNPAASAANFISLLQTSAQAFGTPVQSLEPGPQSLRDSGGLVAQALTIKIQGSFPQLLRFVSNLPHHQTLVRVLDTQFALSGVKHGAGGEPVLDAVLHVRLYRVRAHFLGRS